MSGITYAKVADLVTCLGVRDALKLAQRFGGRRVYVPSPEGLKPEGALCGTLGWQGAVTLAKTWGGQEIMVPKCEAYLARERDRLIHAEPKNLSVRDLAEKYGLTERWVYEILTRKPPAEPERAPDSQRDLFAGS